MKRDFVKYAVLGAVTAAASSLSTASVFSADADHFPSSEGVDFYNERVGGETQSQRVQIDLNEADLDVHIPQPLGTLQTLTSQAAAWEHGNKFPAAGINASFTNPDSLIVKDEAIHNLNLRLPESDESPLFQYQAFGMTTEGDPVIDSYDAEVAVEHEGTSFDVEGVNTGQTTNAAILFTGNYGAAATNENEYAYELVLNNFEKPTGAFGFNETMTGTVEEIRPSGAASPVNDEQAVLSLNGSELREQAENIDAGDEITLTSSVNGAWSEADFMLASGPRLVSDGNVDISMDESLSFAETRHPRSVVGYNAEQNEVMFTIFDGRQSGYSNGATLREAADYMIANGADYALNLDGGGSTTLAGAFAGDQTPALLNRPSGGIERGVSATLWALTNNAPAPIDEAYEPITQFIGEDKWDVSTIRASASYNERSVETDRGGTAAELNYDYTTGDGGTAAVYLDRNQERLLPGSAEKIGAWVQGDGREHWLRGVVTDRFGSSYTINFTEEDGLHWDNEWYYVTAELPEGYEGKLGLERIYTAQPDEDKQAEGTILIDQLDVVYDASYQPAQPPEPVTPEPPEEDEDEDLPTDPAQPDVSFSDMDGEHWGHQNVIELAERGVIQGFEDGTFRPDNSLTRGEAVVMLTRDLDVNADAFEDTDFPDVAEDRFYAAAVAAGSELGWVEGSNGKFRPNESLSRAEMAAILTRAYEIEAVTGGNAGFPDVPSDHWAAGVIETIQHQGITTGDDNGEYRPEDDLSRAEFATFIQRVSN
ncbi:S-layer family protein [Salsuginibacillus halophilus]|uniref:S-layer family protein n=1 Tax=Salsuginibacillus halophilus TaxID=517424 RepID=A0A2P8HQL3_9BACI|nr:phosphodiester glycosidase family protein [Salsuginibacillus halophilus]PSL48520.1 S-layer family protein [Salsuginibacillus halophilus]